MLTSILRNTLLAIPLASINVDLARAVEIQQLTSASGIKSLLVEDYTVPLVSISFSFNGGSLQDENGSEGTADILTTMLDEGAGKYDSQTLQTKLDDVGMQYRFTTSRDKFSGFMKSLVENLDDSAELMQLMLTAPRFDAEPFSRMMDVAEQKLKRQQTDPSSMAARAIRKNIFGEQLYGRSPSGTLASIKNINPDVLRDYHKRIFAKDNLTIGIVGAISSEQANELVEKLFAKLPKQSKLEPIADFKANIGGETHVEFNVPQTTIAIVLDGIKRNDPDFYGAVLINHILGGRGFESRLFQEVREKRGLAYGAYSSLATFEHGGLIQSGSATETARAAETIKIITAELKKMAAEGPSVDELANAKKYIIGSYGVQNLDTSDKIAAVLVALQDYNLGLDYIEKREDYFKSVTLADAKRISKRLFNSTPSIFTVGEKNE